ncbi:MAG: ABC transporter permease [Rhodothermales bacterium]
MIKRVFLIASVALQTLRANPLHTLLSTTGLVVGVAALVAILSLGDGLEEYARNQISTTTSLEAIMIQPKTRTSVNGVSLSLASIPSLKPADTAMITDAIGADADLALRKSINVLIKIPNDTLSVGAYIEATEPAMFEILRSELEAGRFFGDNEVTERAPVLVLNHNLAVMLVASPDEVPTLIGSEVEIAETRATIIGVLKAASHDKNPVAYGAVETWSDVLKHATPSSLLVRAHDVVKVPALREAIVSWLDTHIDEGSEAFFIMTDQARIEQVQKGIKVFKIVMGLITGISVLVGGIGVMNVLLIAITERTREIGIRKATGATRKDIVLQFLTESVTISFAGSLFGLILGLVTLLLATPIIKNVAEVPFEMAFSAGSLSIIVVVALFVGIGFGTYPAWRAANLSPVEAIRHE